MESMAGALTGLHSLGWGCLPHYSCKGRADRRLMSRRQTSTAPCTCHLLFHGRKMRSVLLRTAPMAAALICWAAQSAWASPAEQDSGNAPRITSVASDAVKEASLAPVTEEQWNAVMTWAAAAARRDLDPKVNGSISDIRQVPAASR